MTLDDAHRAAGLLLQVEHISGAIDATTVAGRAIGDGLLSGNADDVAAALQAAPKDVQLDVLRTAARRARWLDADRNWLTSLLA